MEFAQLWPRVVILVEKRIFLRPFVAVDRNDCVSRMRSGTKRLLRAQQLRERPQLQFRRC